ncbi:MAG: hemerythrin domain-containing protein [Lachnospiraceae bacterium]|nr:hemerythrin domain-containing protein [Lachnospiraceae bacterium]
MFDFNFDWQPNMATGIESVDEQHQQLLRIGRDIEQWVRIGCAGVSQKQMVDLLCALRDYTGYHFYTEESLMTECGYEGLQEHQKEHQELMNMVMTYDISKLAQNPLDAMKEAKAALQDIVFNHLLKQDMDFAKAYIKYDLFHKKAVDQKKREKTENDYKFGPEVVELNMTSIHLTADMTYKGHVVIVNKERKSRLTSMTALESSTFFADVIRAAKAVKKVFQPDALEYIYGEDAEEQLVMHLLPKYKDMPDFGKVTGIPEDPNKMTEAECEVLVEELRKEIK